MRFILRYSFLLVLLLSLVVQRGYAQSSPSPSSQIENSSTATASAENTLPPPVDPINITISPISLVLETDPGVPVASQIRLRNNGTKPESLRASIGTFVADETGQRPRLRDAKPEDLFIPWLQLEKQFVVVNPGEWVTIPVTFSPPAEASLSYYYSVTFNRAKAPIANPGETIVEGAPAILVLTTVRSPNAIRELALSELKLQSSIVEYLPQKFEVKVKNNGNVHVAPTGNIFIDGQGKRDLAVLSLNPSNGAILPQTERVYTVEWNDGFPVYTLDPTLPDNSQDKKLRWDFSRVNKFRFGKYTANVLLVYDDGKKDIPIESTITFWVIPWKILGGVALVVTLLGFGVRSVIVSILKRFSKSKHHVEK